MALTRLPLPPKNGDHLAGLVLDAMTKGVPEASGAVALGDVSARHWNLLAGDLPLPAAVLRLDRMEANALWMRAFTETNGLRIAPHGKTTMAPQLFALQLAEGAFAITVATTQQLAVCRRFGVPRVILANEPAGRANVDACFAAIADGALDLHVLADGLAGVGALADGAARAGLARPLNVLVEVGVPGGRTGARGREAALEVARAIAAAPGLALAGVECFEGILGDVVAVDALLSDVLAVADAAAREGLFPGTGPVILSAGGSAYYDRVGELFRDARPGGRETTIVIRSGCYLTHDTIGYDKAYERILAETALALPRGRLDPAIEVWAAVQSRPEPSRAILTMGKRDVSHDAGMPVPIAWFRPGAMAAPAPMPRGHLVTALNDQHCYLGTPGESPLGVGDLVAFGIGHPCTTFDKWGLMMVVDRDYTVVDAVKTFF
jgi:D-serine dehydratase